MSKCSRAASLCCRFSYLLGSPLCFFLGIHHSCSNPNTPFPVYLPKSLYVQAVSLNSVQTRTPAFHFRVKHWQNQQCLWPTVGISSLFLRPFSVPRVSGKMEKKGKHTERTQYEGWLRSCEAALCSTHISVCYMVISGQDPDGL